MNNTFYVNTNSEGVGTPENPFADVPCKHINTGGYCREDEDCRCQSYDKFTAEHLIPLPTYSQNNELIRNQRVEVEPWFAVSAVKGQTPRLLTDEEMNNYHSFEEFKQHKCMLFTYQVYRQVAIKQEVHAVNEPLSKDEINSLLKTETSKEYEEPYDDDFSKKCRQPLSAQPVKEGEEYKPIYCNHKIPSGKYEGFSNFELLSHSSGGGGDEHHDVNLSVCRGCGEVKIQGYRNKGVETHRFCETFSLYYPDAVAAIVKNCNYMNKETDGYIPFFQQPVTPASKAVKSAEEIISDNLVEEQSKGKMADMKNNLPDLHKFIVDCMHAFAAQHQQKKFGPNSGDSICQICDAVNPPWYAENELFNQVNGELRDTGVYCPVCFEKKAKEKGIEVIFKCITASEDRDTLEAQHQQSEGMVDVEAAIEALQGVINLEPLLSYGGDVSDKYKAEAEAISNMLNKCHAAIQILNNKHK